MPTSIEVGQPIRIKGEPYMCIRVTRRKETYLANVDSETIKSNHKLNPCTRGLRPSVLIIRWECEDFEVDDVITEELEEIRFTGINEANPLMIVNYHTYKKEIPYGEQRPEAADSQQAESDNSEADQSGSEGGSSIRPEDTSDASAAGE